MLRPPASPGFTRRCLRPPPSTSLARTLLASSSCSPAIGSAPAPPVSPLAPPHPFLLSPQLREVAGRGGHMRGHQCSPEVRREGCETTEAGLSHWLLSRFSRVRLCVAHRWQPTRLPHPWDSPGKNTGVGCHFLLQCMKVKSESEVAQSCPTLATPWTAAYQAPPPMGFSRQKYWSGVPLPSLLSHWNIH